MSALRFASSLFALLAVPVGAGSQDMPPVDVTGIVVDVSSGQPIPGAGIRIIGTHLRIATDENGRFVIRGIPQGERTWVVEALGYATWEQPLLVEHLDMLKIGLMPRPLALEEIRATVDRLEIRRKLATVAVHSVGSEMLGASVAIDAAGVVRSLMPWVPVSCPADQGPAPSADMRLCIRYRGDARVIPVCIDERPASMAELWAYAADEVHSLDYVGGPRPHVRVYTSYFLESGKPLRLFGLGCAR